MAIDYAGPDAMTEEAPRQKPRARPPEAPPSAPKPDGSIPESSAPSAPKSPFPKRLRTGPRNLLQDRGAAGAKVDPITSTICRIRTYEPPPARGQ